MSRLLLLDGLQALEGLHACSGSTRDISWVLMNEAGPAECLQGSSRPGFCLSTPRALGTCMLVGGEIKKNLSPQVFMCTPGPYRILAKKKKSLLRIWLMGPHCHRAQGSLDQETNLSNRHHRLLRITPLLPVTITGSSWSWAFTESSVSKGIKLFLS